MSRRDDRLEEFLACARAAFDEAATDPASRASLARIFGALDTPGPAGSQMPGRLPVCDCLDAAADPRAAQLASHAGFLEAFRRIEPGLAWYTRDGSHHTAGPGFDDGHANAMIAGPGGLERRTDVWFGVSLMAPHMRYPDHTHPPEETYLVLSDSEFSQDGGPWFRPGIGGSFYNRPGILHAMRSLDTPLLAFWALWAAPHARDERSEA